MSPRIRKVISMVLLAFGLGTVAVPVILKVRPAVDVDSADVLYRQDAAAKPGLRAVFFGTSSLSLTDGVHTVMVDGFFSRPSLWRLLTRFSPDTDEIAFALRKAPPRVDAVFVAHSHHDHAMDAGLVAIQTGALVLGSESTLNLARGQGTPESRLRRLQVRSPLQIGKFRVTAFETPHSPDPVNPGFIAEPIHTPAKLSDYRMAENFSFFVEHPLGKVLIVPSANYTPGIFDGIQADMVVLGIGALGKQSAEFVETYWSEVVRKTGATLVFPVHWDDFTLSLREPLVPMPYFMDNLKAGMTQIGPLARRDGVMVRFLPALQEVTLPATPKR